METSSSVKPDFLCFSPVGSLVSDNGTEFTLPRFSRARAFIWTPLIGCLFSWKLPDLASFEHLIICQIWSELASKIRICEEGAGNRSERGRSVQCQLHFFRKQLELNGSFFSPSLFTGTNVKDIGFWKSCISSLPWKFYPLLSNARWIWCPVQCSWNSSEFQVGSWQLCEYMNHIQAHQMNSISTVQISHT